MDNAIDFSELPNHLFAMIFKRLDSMIDQIHFSAVSSSWRSVALENCQLRLPHQAPLLMISHTEGYNPKKCHFFSISNSRIWTILLPEKHKNWCCGSSKGWIMAIHKIKNEINLVNPFLNWAHVQLPLLDAFPDWNRKMIVKFALSSTPDSTTGYIVMAIVTNLETLSFFKSGDEKWTAIQCLHYPYDDVVYYNGQFYAITRKGGAIVVCDVGPDPKVTEITPADYDGKWKNYLVVSSGELLKILCLNGHVYLYTELRFPFQYPPHYFRVLKLDRSVPKWTLVKSLGDRSLFIGRDCSVSLSVNNFPGYQGNYIYFPCDWKQHNKIAVFDLEGRPIKPSYSILLDIAKLDEVDNSN